MYRGRNGKIQAQKPSGKRLHQNGGSHRYVTCNRRRAMADEAMQYIGTFLVSPRQARHWCQRESQPPFSKLVMN